MNTYTTKKVSTTLFAFLILISVGFAQNKGKKPTTAPKPATPVKAPSVQVVQQGTEQSTLNDDIDKAAKDDQVPVTYFFSTTNEPAELKPLIDRMERFVQQIPKGTFGPVSEMSGVYHISLPSKLLGQAFKTQFSSVCLFTLNELMDMQRILQQDPSLLKAYIR